MLAFHSHRVVLQKCTTHSEGKTHSKASCTEINARTPLHVDMALTNSSKNSIGLQILMRNKSLFGQNCVHTRRCVSFGKDESVSIIPIRIIGTHSQACRSTTAMRSISERSSWMTCLSPIDHFYDFNSATTSSFFNASMDTDITTSRKGHSLEPLIIAVELFGLWNQ